MRMQPMLAMLGGAEIVIILLGWLVMTAILAGAVWLVYALIRRAARDGSSRSKR